MVDVFVEKCFQRRLISILWEGRTKERAPPLVELQRQRVDQGTDLHTQGRRRKPTERGRGEKHQTGPPHPQLSTRDLPPHFLSVGASLRCSSCLTFSADPVLLPVNPMQPPRGLSLFLSFSLAQKWPPQACFLSCNGCLRRERGSGERVRRAANIAAVCFPVL